MQENSKNKRRSEIWKRRSISSESTVDFKEKEEFENYHSELQNEHMKWKALLAHRKAEQHSAFGRYSQLKEQPEVLSVKDVWDDLTDDQREFVKNRPDYNKVVSDLQELVETAAIDNQRLEIVDRACGSLCLRQLARLKVAKGELCSAPSPFDNLLEN